MHCIFLWNIHFNKNPIQFYTRKKEIKSFRGILARLINFEISKSAREFAVDRPSGLVRSSPEQCIIFVLFQRCPDFSIKRSFESPIVKEILPIFSSMSQRVMCEIQRVFFRQIHTPPWVFFILRSTFATTVFIFKHVICPPASARGPLRDYSFRIGLTGVHPLRFTKRTSQGINYTIFLEFFSFIVQYACINSKGENRRS